MNHGAQIDADFAATCAHETPRQTIKRHSGQQKIDQSCAAQVVQQLADEFKRDDRVGRMVKTLQDKPAQGDLDTDNKQRRRVDIVEFSAYPIDEEDVCQGE